MHICYIKYVRRYFMQNIKNELATAIEEIITYIVSFFTSKYFL